MSLYLLIFLEFFRVGLFSIGGGLATLPFLYEMAERYPFLDQSVIADAIAIGQSAPGPLGVNMATYVGYQIAGIPGGIIAAGALTLPSFLIILIIAGFLKGFEKNPYVISVLSHLRPAVTGLILLAAFQVFQTAIFDVDRFLVTGNVLDIFLFKEIILFLVLFLVTRKLKMHPFILIIIAATVGILLAF